jgi:predicted metal-dependent hydrolase
LFVISKLRWIKKNQAKFSDQPRQSPKEYVSGESHYFKGDRFKAYLTQFMPNWKSYQDELNTFSQSSQFNERVTPVND